MERILFPNLVISGLVQLKFGDADKSTLNDGVIGSHWAATWFKLKINVRTIMMDKEVIVFIIVVLKGF